MVEVSRDRFPFFLTCHVSHILYPVFPFLYFVKKGDCDKLYQEHDVRAFLKKLKEVQR